MRTIALDVDGVLLDYCLAYSDVWAKVFGERPVERDPNAYWPIDRWQVRQLDGSSLIRFRSAFDEEFWSSIPAIPGAFDACQMLSQAGFEIVCVTALPERFAKARLANLRAHSFPVEVVYTVQHENSEVSPKAEIIGNLRPVAFVDDYLPYFAGLTSDAHRALILGGANGTPNVGELLRFVDSSHTNLWAFATWWLKGPGSVEL